MARKKNPFAHLNISWATMKVGTYPYKGTAKGAKANACRASKAYYPKRWRTFTEGRKVFIERLPDLDAG